MTRAAHGREAQKARRPLRFGTEPLFRSSLTHKHTHTSTTVAKKAGCLGGEGIPLSVPPERVLMEGRNLEC